MRFRISADPIRPESTPHDAAGGFVTFEGKVRNHAEGQAVLGLEYEAYAEMAEAQGTALLDEAIAKFGLLDAVAWHRVGKLDIGDTAIVVQCAAAHRREAFEACEWIMDQVKWRVPIWKRETYSTGLSEWVQAGAPVNSSSDEGMFTRQMRLPQVGKEGQHKLQHARVLLVGVGGIAAGSLPALVGAGIGTLGLLDPDVVDLTNLHRQTLFTVSDQGRLKVERAAAFAKRLRPSIHVESYPERLAAGNVDALIRSFDWVLDGTDSLDTKFLLNRACRAHRKPLITASVHQFEGQLMTVLPDGPCLQCLFPEPPPEHCVGTCAQSGVLGVVPQVLGALQANELIKGVLGLPTLEREVALVDFLSLSITTLRRETHAQCLVCSGRTSTEPSEWDIETLPDGNFRLVDIRDLDEVPRLTIPHESVPAEQCYAITWEHPTVFVCASGRRSYRLVANLRASGHNQVFSLKGGIENASL